MTTFQKTVLAAIKEHGPHTTGELALIVKASTSGTGLALSKLKQADAVVSERKSGQDHWALRHGVTVKDAPPTPVEDVVEKVRTRVRVLKADNEALGYEALLLLEKAFKMVMEEEFGVEPTEEHPSTV